MLLIYAMITPYYSPRKWKPTTVVFCLQKHDKLHLDPFRHRSFSLLFSLSKVDQKIILARLREFADANHILLHFEHGFQKKHDWNHKLNWGFMLLMFLHNVPQAFDRVRQDELFLELIRCRYSSNWWNLFLWPEPIINVSVKDLCRKMVPWFY